MDAELAPQGREQDDGNWLKIGGYGTRRPSGAKRREAAEERTPRRFERSEKAATMGLAARAERREAAEERTPRRFERSEKWRSGRDSNPRPPT